jgi:hypothetical protein
MKRDIFWDMMPCSALKVNRRFGATCLLHLQLEALHTASSFHGLFFYPEDSGDIFLRNIGLLSKDYTALYPEQFITS